MSQEQKQVTSSDTLLPSEKSEKSLETSPVSLRVATSKFIKPSATATQSIQNLSKSTLLVQNTFQTSGFRFPTFLPAHESFPASYIVWAAMH